MAVDEDLRVSPEHLETVPTFDLRRFYLQRRGDNTVDARVKERPALRVLARLTDSFPFNLLWGDGGLVYILAGYRRGKQLVEREGVTHLFSSFRPIADHAIAALLKRRFPQLVWIADYRDLPVNRALDNVCWPRLQHAWQRRLLRRADLVTTVSEGLARQLRRYHPRVYVLPNGIGDFPDGLPPTPRSSKFTIAYIGSLYPDVQDGRPLLRSLRRLMAAGLIDRQQLQLVVAGRDNACWRRWARACQLEDCLLDLGFLPRAEALALQRRSHINLWLSWSLGPDQGILTAKLYEYLAARRPILGLVNGTKDEEIDALFGRLRHCLLQYELHADPDLLDTFLAEHYLRWTKGLPPPESIDAAGLAAFSWEQRMVGLMRVLGGKNSRTEEQ